MPTPEDANPDASSAIANANAAGWSSTRPRPACTPSRVSVSGMSVPKNSAAAMISIAALTSPAMPHPDDDVDLLAAEQEAALGAGVSAGIRDWVSAECR